MEQVSESCENEEKQTKDVSLIERLFKLSEHNTSVKTELMAGLTTFVTMSYIMFLNPVIMSNTGMPFDGLFLATCLGAAIATILMGMYANWPVGLAPGLGVNALCTFSGVGGMGYSWHVALVGVLRYGGFFVLMMFLIHFWSLRRTSWWRHWRAG